MTEPLPDAAIAEQYDAALRRAAAADAVEPRAAAAWFDADARRLRIELTSGVCFALPVDAEPALAELDGEVLAAVRLASAGRALHWPGPDLHLDVPGLIAAAINLSAWAPKYLGSRTSAAKAEAARANGRKGGRPRRRVRSPE
jgi:hypothetical protein